MVFILLALDGVGSVRIFWLSCFYVPRSRWWVALRRRLHGNEASEVVVMYLLVFQSVACDAVYMLGAGVHIMYFFIMTW